MKRLFLRLTALLCAFSVITCSLSSCAAKEEKAIAPELSQVRQICELATLECYYHTVAKYSEEGGLFGIGSKKLWIPYSGVVKIGIDMSQLKMVIDENVVTVTMPYAKVLSCVVDKDSLLSEQIVSEYGLFAGGDVQNELDAYTYAQDNIEQSVANDSAILNDARERAKSLIKSYIENIGAEYVIVWINPDDDSAAVPDKAETAQSV